MAATKTYADLVNDAYFDNIKKVTLDAIASLPDEIRLRKGEYVCYFLRSDKAPQRTYSGSTNDFPHRLRQHNGLLVGGAKMTESTRPWRPALIIYGFPSQSSALRFEYFTKTKHTKIDAEGLNALQRRAHLIVAAEQRMVPTVRQLLRIYSPDPYFRECFQKARITRYDETPLVLMLSHGKAIRKDSPVLPDWHTLQGNILKQKKKKDKEDTKKLIYVSSS